MEARQSGGATLGGVRFSHFDAASKIEIDKFHVRFSCARMRL
jgi:hypothetical protein